MVQGRRWCKVNAVDRHSEPGPVARWKPDVCVEILIARSPLRAASCSEARCGAARATADSREVNTRRDQSAPSARKARPAGLRADLVRVCCQLYLLARTVPGHPGGSVLCDRQESLVVEQFRRRSRLGSPVVRHFARTASGTNNRAGHSAVAGEVRAVAELCSHADRSQGHPGIRARVQFQLRRSGPLGRAVEASTPVRGRCGPVQLAVERESLVVPWRLEQRRLDDAPPRRVPPSSGRAYRTCPNPSACAQPGQPTRGGRPRSFPSVWIDRSPGVGLGG